ncbi:myb-like DNA-binding protein (nucleomorph) [Chroomonas mesostigmatica CCMP1168]|uniref:Myb-like DNA-binding protein n=1 Tax=Chroomonas mesostigmatica CCMP1168 TaxID=1195612 RepID=J7GB88_9CRYP|nr:myb-like DNA-binding protein [Chroomonas mesostigmatica CCMP1168]|mmetsp:Transcript_65865/g.162133  ORF Transcript_65865/g.162133 Transcript_65865/m.162133 type:complete len:311 (+) Transcript_65865:1465-2397(+)
MFHISNSFNKETKDYKSPENQINIQNVEEKTTKEGPFSRLEQIIVAEAIKQVLDEEGIPYEVKETMEISSLPKKKLPKNFWKRVGAFLPSRKVESIYDHARRRFSSKNYQGIWTEDEVSRLKDLVQIYGHQWTKIGLNLHRLPGACYDKWRDALKNGERKKKGKWSQEERCKLIQLITLQIGHENISYENFRKTIRWTLVAEKIGTRSYLQCRNEWSRFFSPGSKIKLTFEHSLMLLDAINSLGVSDETEIKWGNLLDGVPAHKTYNKWRSLCRKYLGEETKKGQIIPLNCAIGLIKDNLFLKIGEIACS